MSITSINFVISQFETEKYRYFIIYDDENDIIFTQNDLIDQESAIVKIRNFFRDNNGFFTIKVFSKKLTNPKNRVEQDKFLVTKFNVELTHKLNMQQTNSPNQNNGFGSLSSDDPRSNAPNIYDIYGRMGQQETTIKLMEKDHQHYREMKELQERIERMEKESEKATGMNGVLSTVTENFKDPAVLMGLLSNIGGLFKKQEVVAMNGVDMEVGTNVNERKTKMINAVNLLMKLDPNFSENISALATLCEKKQDTYKLAVNYLKSM